jgi:Flp pilus assembly protein TadD/4-amino-4-deoxy-L-arabinose transferase-like glycosyltransferase
MARRGWSIALVFGVALAVRAVHLWSLSSSPLWTATMGDAVAYLEWARRIAGGDWIGTETFYQAPLYPYFLATILKLSGASVGGVKVVQIVIGATSCALLAWGAGRLFTPATGLVAGLILAFYPPAIFFDGLIQKTVLDSVLIARVIAFVALMLVRTTWPRTIGMGVALGLLALTRENALIGIPLVIWWLWLLGPGWQKASAGVLLGTALVLLPVGLRNAAVGGTFQLTTAQLGPNLYIGNNPAATGLYVPLRPGHGSAEFERRDAIELAEAAAGRTLDPGEVSDYWRSLAVTWATSHPRDWLRLFLKKVLLTWNAEESADTEDIATYAEASPVLRLRRVLNFGVLAPLGLLGMWIHRARWRELGVLYGLVPVYTLAVAAFYVFDRYRFPLVPVLVVFAAAALTYGAAWWRSSSAGARLSGVAIVVVAGVVSNWPLLSPGAMQASTAFNLGYYLARTDRPDEAAEAYRRSIELLPTHARARSSLGGLLTQRGEHDEALSQLREATRLDPTLPSAWTNLGIELASRRQADEAVSALQRALILDPTNIEATYNLGVAFASLGDDERALRYLREVVLAQPSHALAQNNIGVILATHGDMRGAVEHFTKAVESAPSNPEFARNLEGAKAIVAEQRSTAPIR